MQGNDSVAFRGVSQGVSKGCFTGGVSQGFPAGMLLNGVGGSYVC